MNKFDHCAAPMVIFIEMPCVSHAKYFKWQLFFFAMLLTRYRLSVINDLRYDGCLLPKYSPQL